jgi:ubiquinone/menaquinone biosynthesis C-methylase UbiE
MSWLLDRRGLEVVSYDLEDKRLEKFIRPDIPFHRAPNDRDLPFPDASFDGVLSCGVLEHVPDERYSLAEIRRILRPGGCLFIYQLPQVYAYTEFINRMRGLWYHPRRYTVKGAVNLFREAGFDVATCRRSNLFPKNLTGLPSQARDAYNHLSRHVMAIESVLVRIPMLNWLCHSLEFVLYRNEGKQPRGPERDR